MVKNNRFDLMTAAIVSSALADGETFVDVGANWGYFTCIGSRRVGPSGLVLAIEPNWLAHHRLLETIHRERLVNVMPMPYAAYDSLGKPVSLVKSAFRQTTSSYVREDRIEGRFETLTSTLDYMVSKVAPGSVRLIKVDTEGAELPVMRGARAILAEWKPLVILEVSEYSKRFGYAMDELYDYMTGLGYSRTYFIQDIPGEWKLWGPLTEVVEGQILFQHERSDSAFPFSQV